MDGPACSGCAERDARIADLERRLAELEARSKTNASNSGTPPSANPLGADKPVKKKKSKRRRDAQPDHPPDLTQLLPAEQVTRTKHIVPETSKSSHAELQRDAGPNDPEPKRFQTADVVPISLKVIEYQAHAWTCWCCDQVTEVTIPAALRAHSIGPRRVKSEVRSASHSGRPVPAAGVGPPVADPRSLAVAVVIVVGLGPFPHHLTKFSRRRFQTRTRECKIAFLDFIRLSIASNHAFFLSNL